METEEHGVGGFHGGFGSATLRECLDRIDQSQTETPATLHSGGGTEDSAIPPQFQKHLRFALGDLGFVWGEIRFTLEI